MGLREQVQRGVVTAFQSIGNLAGRCTYQSLTGNIVRDLVAGTSVAESVSYTLRRVVFAKFKESENDKDVNVSTDEKMLFPALDLPIEPKSADTVLDAQGRTWEIIKRLSDPASAVVILQVRTSR